MYKGEFKLKRILYLLIIVSIFISACGIEKSVQETTKEGITSPGLPLMWINYKGDKYILQNVYSKEELDLAAITSTSTFTGEGDGTEHGEEIFIEQPSGDLFIIDNSGPNEEWARFIKNEKE